MVEYNSKQASKQASLQASVSYNVSRPPAPLTFQEVKN